MSPRVYALMADRGGCAFYRVLEPSRALADQGADVVTNTEVAAEASEWTGGEVFVHSVGINADVLVVQRPLSQRMHALVLAAKKQGIRVCVEIDDDFHSVHPHNVAASAVDPALNQWHNRNWLTRTIEAADALVVSTPALLKYARPGQPATVVENRVPARVLDLKPASEPDAVGWTGTMRTHPADLSRARGLMSRVDRPFHVVGDGTGVASAVGVAPARLTESPWLNSIDAYYQEVADRIAVGIAPLEPSKFNRAKSWLKIAEYAALGIPYVASRSDEYARFHAECRGGLLAQGAGPWSKSVEAVCANREELSGRARAWAQEHTVEAHAGEWFAAWTRALENK